MKRDAFAQLKTKRAEELSGELPAAREKLRALKQEAIFGKLKNVRGIRAARKHVARLLTLIAEQTSP